MIRKGHLLLLGIAVVPYILVAATGKQAKHSYAKDVLPVMKAHCASCHAGAGAAAGLDLTTVAGIKKVVEAKNSGKSPLVLRMRGIGGAQMPMGFAPLSKEVVDSIAAWIDEGAAFDAGTGKHWAYIPPKQPSVPISKLKWGRNPIDAFILDRLTKEGLRPAAEASKETLLRRVYLDLIGLPPSPKEVDAFLADKRPDAYERVVDALLKNPHFGEKQAEPWLDLSRYADSDGYEKDLNRTAWKYRDWLIDAFNRNLPYDRFTIEQLAGDLLPNPTLDQLVATGFNRNTMFNREGGVDQAEAHFNVVLDRVNTTATVWLGSTLQCARCHDHKYDPFTQRDFYKMAAFYSHSVILPQGSKEIGEEKWFESEIRVPSPVQAREEKDLTGKVALEEKKVADWRATSDKAYMAWKIAAAKGADWVTLNPVSMSAAKGSTLTASSEGIITATGAVPKTENYTIKAATSGKVTGLRLEAIADPTLPSGGPGRAENGNFLVNKIRLEINGKPANFSRAVADFDQQQYGAARLLENNPDAGWAVDGATGKSHAVVLELKEPIEVAPKTPLEVTIDQHWPGGYHSLGKFRLSLTQTPNPAFLFTPPALKPLLDKPSLTPKEDKMLRDFFVANTPALDPVRGEEALNRGRLARLLREVPTALVMKDQPVVGPLTTHIHNRGEFLSPTELVSAGFPEVLESKPETPNAKLTRLDLAKWLVDRGNPLTSRVEVNRLWEEFFGRGIVATSEDFGTQGSRPSHPELLDWLACEFVDKGWDIKEMIRLIVTSSTYRQSSTATIKDIQDDPENILLGRGPRFRLDAETIRDNALAAAGVLSSKIGGPSVFPYQPEGVWDDPYSGQQWMTSKGEDRFRRGLYTFTKRSSPYPSFVSFDSTSRESCTVRRIRTNTPLQALAMLNDEGIFQAAKALAQRMAKEGGPKPIEYGFRLCTGRKPSSQELARMEKLRSSLLSRYQTKPDEAKKLAETPEKASLTMVANVLLNLDETVTKD